MNFRMNIDERRRIEEMLNDGITASGISKVLKRSPSCISSEIKKNGGTRFYNAEKAQENSERLKYEANKDKNSPVQHLRKRVDELENKVKFLLENR